MKIALLAFLILAAACSRTQQPERHPLVVLRFENLSGDPALNWICRGAARQLGAELEGAGVADSREPAAERERAVIGGVTRILHGYISRSGDKLRLRADLEDAATRQFLRSGESTGAIASGLLPLVHAVAQQIDPAAHVAGAHNEAALSAYVAGLDAHDASSAMDSFSRAVAADPDYGAAYIALIELSQSRKDKVGAERFLALARSRGEAISVVDRARLDVSAAQISGNRAAISQSLAALSRLTPADANLLRSLADSELQAKRYAAAIDYYKKALAAEPGDASLLNNLGYAQAYAQNLDEAVTALREYERAHPQDANPLDSLGDVNFYLGRFPEAEKFYRQAYAKDPFLLNGGSLVKAATAHLLTGDPGGAEGIFAEYETARRGASDPMIDLTRAQWDYLRGKRKDAIRELETFATTSRIRDLSSLAHANLTVWWLEAGDAARARQQAAQAVSTAAGPGTAALAAACQYVAAPSERTTQNPIARAYALLLSREFAAALPLLREIDARSAPSPHDAVPTLLAWALVETGHFEEAEKHLLVTPVPTASGPAPFESLLFPRIFQLRAIVAQKKGNRPLAEQNARLFKTLS